VLIFILHRAMLKFEDTHAKNTDFIEQCVRRKSDNSHVKWQIVQMARCFRYCIVQQERRNI